MKTQVEKRAREYANRYGYRLRRVSHSTQHPNGYIKILTPSGKELRAKDMIDVIDVIYRDKIKK